MKLPFLLFMLSIVMTAYTQTSIHRPDVFLDCQQTNCYEVYLKQEVDFINYIRDRQAADIYVLVTNQSASAGAREYQLIFSTERGGAPVSDTLVYYRAANIAEAEERKQFVRFFKKGLLPHISRSDIMDFINYDFDIDVSDMPELQEEKDPWNYWSFNVRLNLNLDGEASFEEQGYFSRISAAQVTERHKIFIVAFHNYSSATFTLSDGEEVNSINKRTRGFFQYVKSINDHWSMGVRTLAGSSSFGNTDFEYTVMPAIEYNIYPYSENSTKRFTLLYATGLDYRDYTDLTVFGKLKESLIRQSLDIEFEQTQQWGNMSVDFEFDQFLHDLTLFSISITPNIELNIVKGLSIEFGGNVSYVANRVNIAKAEISDQDIILQNRQLDTSYSYSSYFGFNYRFGSQSNNIVNPRF